MAAPFYNLPSPDDERDEDERLSRQDWLAQYGSTRTAPAVMSDALPPRAAPTTPAPAQMPEGATFNEKDVWGALATKNAPKPALAPTPTPSEQMQAEGQKQKALGNEDKAARAFVQATQMGAQENASAGAANQRPVPELVPVTKGAVGQAQRPASQGAHGVDLERPPEYQAPNAGGYWIALIADAMLNKGRGMGRIVQGFAERPDAQHVNYQRRMQHEKDVAGIEATQRRGFLSPEEEAMRQKRIEIAEANLAARQGQIDNQTRGIALREEKQRAEMEPGSPQAERIAEQLEARGVPSDRLRDAQGRALSIYEQKQLSPAIKNEIELAMGEQMNALAADKARGVAQATIDPKVETAQRISAATLPDKLALAAAGDERKIAAEERAAERQERYRKEDYSKWYSKEAEKDLGIARLMDDIDASGGAAPETLAERLKGSLAGWGIGTPERLETWQAKQMVLELWARQQTGAAISASEDQRFAIQAGTSPTASREQIEAAYKVMGNVVETWLRSKGAGNPDAARSVVSAAGANDERWLGASKPAPRTSTPRSAQRRAPAAASSAEDEWVDEGAAPEDEWEDM